MNKQEAIDEIENAIPDFILNDYQRGKETGLTYALELVKQLDEPVKPPEPAPWQPEKPVVPQFVADWYENNKDDFEYNLYRLCIDFCGRKLHEDLHEWFNFDKNKPIETLVLMHKFGYEIEKERLYIARNKTTGEHLYFNNAKKKFESGSLLTSYVKNVKAYHHTQDKLEKLNYWGNSLFEFEEVDE